MGQIEGRNDWNASKVRKFSLSKHYNIVPQNLLHGCKKGKGGWRNKGKKRVSEIKKEGDTGGE